MRSVKCEARNEILRYAQNDSTFIVRSHVPMFALFAARTVILSETKDLIREY